MRNIQPIHNLIINLDQEKKKNNLINNFSFIFNYFVYFYILNFIFLVSINGFKFLHEICLS